MSSANPNFHTAGSTQDLHPAAEAERDSGSTIQSYSGKVWQYLVVTILLINPTFRLFNSLCGLLMTTSSWVRYKFLRQSIVDAIPACS